MPNLGPYICRAEASKITLKCPFKRAPLAYIHLGPRLPNAARAPARVTSEPGSDTLHFCASAEQQKGVL